MLGRAQPFQGNWAFSLSGWQPQAFDFVVLFHPKNWSLKSWRLQLQSQCNKKQIPDYPTVACLNGSRCLPYTTGELQAFFQALVSKVPADRGREGSSIMGKDTPLTSPAALSGLSPSLARMTTGWRLPVIPARSSLHGIPYLLKPSLGAGVQAAKRLHLCCYLQHCLESTIFHVQGLRAVGNTE